MADSEFARRMLEKQGWKDGDGLGKKKNGISKPIKVNLKMDKGGVGHNTGDDFNDHWWLRVFNEAASSISSSNKPPPVPEKPLPQNKLYQGFRKGATLNNDKEDKDSDCSSEDEDTVNPSELPTLDELHKFCGGATGHRAATLGIKMEGKLKRAAEQERLFQDNIKTKENGNSDQSEKKKKKKKKKKGKSELDQEDSLSPDVATLHPALVTDIQQEETSDTKQNKTKLIEENNDNCNENIVEEGIKKKKSKKKKRKREEIEDGQHSCINGSPPLSLSEQMPSSKKKKKSRKVDIDNPENGEETKEVIQDADTNEKSKHKKKKKKNHDD